MVRFSARRSVFEAVAQCFQRFLHFYQVCTSHARRTTSSPHLHVYHPHNTTSNTRYAHIFRTHDMSIPSACPLPMLSLHVPLGAKPTLVEMNDFTSIVTHAPWPRKACCWDTAHASKEISLPIVLTKIFSFSMALVPIQWVFRMMLTWPTSRAT